MKYLRLQAIFARCHDNVTAGEFAYSCVELSIVEGDLFIALLDESVRQNRGCNYNKKWLLFYETRRKAQCKPFGLVSKRCLWDF